MWLFLAVFFSLLAGMVADGLYPVQKDSGTEQVLANSRAEQAISRISPTTLYDEAVSTIMNPSVRTLGPVLVEQAYGAIKGTLP